MPRPDITWLDDPEEHDYPAAVDYLGLLVGPANAEAAVDALRDEPTHTRKAKDILRAASNDGNPLTPLLPEHNAHVAKNLRKIAKGVALSPVLLVVDVEKRTLVIADGDHRVCAAYHTDENAEVPCRIAIWDRD